MYLFINKCRCWLISTLVQKSSVIISFEAVFFMVLNHLLPFVVIYKVSMRVITFTFCSLLESGIAWFEVSNGQLINKMHFIFMKEYDLAFFLNNTCMYKLILSNISEKP